MVLFSTLALVAAITPNQFKDAPNDSAAIQAAVDLAVKRGESVTVPAWNERAKTNLWVISETVKLPSGATVYLDNCRLMLAPKVFCNVFSNAKAWTGDRNLATAEEHDIKIIGLGHAVLDGGEYNRYGERSVPGEPMAATYAENVARLPKPLVNNSFVYLHNVRNFEVRGLHLYHQRYWSMCFSFCSEGEIRDIRMEADISYVSDDGFHHDPNRRPTVYKNLWVKNGDGIDLRTGCHNILVENISGWTEDDTVALTNLRNGETADWVAGKSTDIHHVVIRNVRAGCWRWMNLVRLLCADGNRVHDIDIDTVVDLRYPGWDWRIASAVQINDDASEYYDLRNPMMGDIYNVSVRNVYSGGCSAIRLFNPMQNVTIENVYLTAGSLAAVMAQGGCGTELRNVVIRNVHAAPDVRLKAIFDLHAAKGDLKVCGVHADAAENLERLSACDLKIDWEDVNVGVFTKGRSLVIKPGERDCGGRWYSADLEKDASPAVADFEKGWLFSRGERKNGALVDLPHDGAIDFDFDLKRWNSGCGALPYNGHGEYVKRLPLDPKNFAWRLEVGGAMSHSKVYVNGKLAAEHPFGYAAYVVPLDGLLVAGTNEFRVTVDPPADSSRWYPGFGLIRGLKLVAAPQDHVVPGSVAFAYANVSARSADVTVTWEMSKSGPKTRRFTVANPQLWSPENPYLYAIDIEGETFRYGIRTLTYDPAKGFFLNGQHRQMRGVCVHHDLGLFGAAFEPVEVKRRLELLKAMGCDAIRTSHNPPSAGFLDLCDEMGFMVMAEAFDEWKMPKVGNGMAKLWDKWHVAEAEALVKNARRHPCVVMWSAGNELVEDVRAEWAEAGGAIGRELTAIFRRLDPEGRPVTAGHWMDATATNAIGRSTDIYGANYLPRLYASFRGRQGVIGTETCSTGSSRGLYGLDLTNENLVAGQVLASDLYPVNPNDYSPDVEFAAQEANLHCYGEFVWTGFDYLGEPDPWRTHARSACFGIFDLAGFPKDRYWLYKSQWKPHVPEAHIAMHWNGRPATRCPCRSIPPRTRRSSS